MRTRFIFIKENDTWHLRRISLSHLRGQRRASSGQIAFELQARTSQAHVEQASIAHTTRMVWGGHKQTYENMHSEMQ